VLGLPRALAIIGGQPERFAPFADFHRRAALEAGHDPLPRLGSPQEVTEKILFQHEIFGHERFLGQITVGTLPHDKAMHAIELLGTEVAPSVRKDVARRTAGNVLPLEA
jgi:hypothetical protein